MSGSQKLSNSPQAEAALRESEDHYRAIADAATDAIITIDSDSTILIVNPATERIFGYSTEELIGQPLTMLMPEYLRHLHEAGIARYRETGRRHIQWSAAQLPGLHKTGKEIPLEISFADSLEMASAASRESRATSVNARSTGQAGKVSAPCRLACRRLRRKLA